MTNLERVLAKAFMDIVISIDLTDDGVIDPDVATSLLEPVAALLQGMAQDDRRALIDLFAECAQEVQDPDRRMVADDLPDALGLH
jgi:hypothetical protein